MGVDDGVVVPALRCAEAALAELAGRDHSVLRLSVDRVAVDIQVVFELVVLLELFELAERLRDQVGVEDADARRGLGIRAQRTGLGRRGRVIGNRLHVRHTVGGAGGVDVALDVRRLERLGARDDGEPLDDRGVDRADHDRTDQQQCGADDRQSPAADGCGDEEQDGNERRDNGEDLLGRDGRVHLGIAGASGKEARARAGDRGVLVEPDADRLQGNVDADRDRDLDARGARDPQLTTVQTNGPIEVTGGEGGDDGDDQHSRGERHDASPERQLEHVERHVEVELRVFDTE